MKQPNGLNKNILAVILLVVAINMIWSFSVNSYTTDEPPPSSDDSSNVERQPESATVDESNAFPHPYKICINNLPNSLIWVFFEEVIRNSVNQLFKKEQKAKKNRKGKGKKKKKKKKK